LAESISKKPRSLFVRIDDRLASQVDEDAARLHLSQNDIVRLALLQRFSSPQGRPA
jgi:Ribbon-helix-helix protein, copG family